MKMIKFYSCCALIVAAVSLQSFMAGDDTLTKEGDVYVVNTTTIGKNIEG